MSLIEILLIVFCVVNLAMVAWLISRSRKDSEDNGSQAIEQAVALLKAEVIARQSESMHSLRDSLDGTQRVIDERLSAGAEALDRRLAVFAEVEGKLRELATQAKSIEVIGQNIQSLSELLRPPQLRGALGERFLEQLLSEILPDALWDTQYRFVGGQRVDAVIKLADKLIPIDSKFPLDAYERVREHPEDTTSHKQFIQAIKKHVDAIAQKYILPAEKTTDFAIMYVPSEAVYYHLVSREGQDSLSYALSCKVIPSSPGHLYGFLASLSAMYGEMQLAGAGFLRGSRDLADGLAKLAESTNNLAGHHQRLEGSLRQMNSTLERSRKELGGMQQSLESLRQPGTSDNSVTESDPVTTDS